MLPYTTYHIPESLNNQTHTSGKWLWMVVPSAFSDGGNELLTKISVALKADFEKDVFVMIQEDHDPIALADIPGDKPNLIISFGLAPEQIGLWIDLTKPGIRIMEPFTFILTLRPEALISNASAKKELWQSMQVYLESHSS